jgi:hypothetical protein
VDGKAAGPAAAGKSGRRIDFRNGGPAGTPVELQMVGSTGNRPPRENRPVNLPNLPDGNERSSGAVFVLALEEYGLYFVSESREIVSRFEPLRAVDRAASSRTSEVFEE